MVITNTFEKRYSGKDEEIESWFDGRYGRIDTTLKPIWYAIKKEHIEGTLNKNSQERWSILRNRAVPYDTCEMRNPTGIEIGWFIKMFQKVRGETLFEDVYVDISSRMPQSKEPAIKNNYNKESGKINVIEIPRGNEDRYENVGTSAKLLYNQARMVVAEEKIDHARVQDKFTEKYNLQGWPPNENFYSNPFVYEGERIGLKAEFKEMISATKAILKIDVYDIDYIVVSDIPKGIFTESGVDVLLAAKVIGKIDIQLPIFGTVSVPHLKFVGISFE